MICPASRPSAPKVGTSSMPLGRLVSASGRSFENCSMADCERRVATISPSTRGISSRSSSLSISALSSESVSSTVYPRVRATLLMPLTSSAKCGLRMSATTTPMARLLPVMTLRACGLAV